MSDTDPTGPVPANASTEITSGDRSPVTETTSALVTLRPATPDEAGAYLVAVPDAPFWQGTRPHVLRLVSDRPGGGPLLYVVRPELADDDRAALDTVLARQGGPVPHFFNRPGGGQPFTEWRLFRRGPTVEMVAIVPAPR